MDGTPPTKEPIGVYPVSESDDSVCSSTTIPWIDVHQHTQSLTWNEREAFDISGCRATVMIAASYYWSPYRPVSAEDVRFLWDDAIRRAARFNDSHFYEQYLAIGIHTWSRVTNPESALAHLPDYCDLDAVVAVGETGIDSSQHTLQWDLDEQRAVVREQFSIADDAGLPVIVHTPGGKDTVSDQYTDYYEELDADFPAAHFEPETAKRAALGIDLELVDEVGISEERVLIDHADETIVADVLEGTNCYLGFSVGSPWFRGVDANLVASVIEEYGSERIIVDTDMLGAMKHDPYTMKRLILDLSRLGVSHSDIRNVVYENPQDLLGF
ncbi:TatD family hydrolase [Haloarchaeobius salinus]|uniref:TatD family hydrolase n=1 Tax=Haloarchaeobius salinus TaxID=1198298 RepID=UPI002108F95B|nr:TatD family hydrolase [Haloarchaeobius salinus]